MIQKLIIRFCDLYLKHYRFSLAVALILFGLGLFFLTRLTINTNQLSLLPDDLEQVQQVKKIEKMVGSVGFFIITLNHRQPDEGDRMILRARRLKLQGRDREADDLIAQANKIYAANYQENVRSVGKLKKASDELYTDLIKLPEVRFIQHKFKLDFLTKHVLLRLETDDLRELFRRLGRKRDELVEKADPFYIELEKQPVYKLRLTDIIKKYSRIGKKEVVDDYYVSPDRRMMVMLFKLNFSMLDIARSKDFIGRVKKIVDSHRLEERGIKVGYSGSYVTYTDDYDSVFRSLPPTLALATILIIITLFLFIRKKRMIGAVLVSLVYSIVIIFGLTSILIGRLNIVTSMMGSILAGLGIDFGIHFVFRFREEFSANQDLHLSIKNTILTTGSAAAWSASTTAAAFFVLMFSDFRGFSELGMIAVYGIFITALCMFFLTPLQLVIYQKFSPDFLKYLQKEPLIKSAQSVLSERFNLRLMARVIPIIILVLFIPAIYFSQKVGFDYDSRNMLEANKESELLKEEMNIRYEITGSPLGMVVDGVEDAAAVWEYFEPLSKKQSEYISQVVGVFGFVPPLYRQRDNEKLMQKFRRESSMVKRGLLPDKYRKYWSLYQEAINARPYAYDDLPVFIKDQFRNIPSSPIKGHLLFIYPNVDKLYLANDVQALDHLLGRIEYPLLGRRTIMQFAHYITEWEKKHHHRIRGSSEKRSVAGLQLTEREINGVLEIANNIDEKTLQNFRFFPAVNRIILKDRPFRSIDDMQRLKKTAITTGPALLVAKFISIVLREARYIIIATIILACAILFISFRNPAYTFLGLVPLVAGMTLMLATMGIFDIRINFFNLGVVPVIIGYGINNSIFMLRRFLESGELNSYVFRTGFAVTASSLTTLAGWGSLAAASHPGLRSMGYVACIGLGFMLIVSVTLLPALMQLITEKQRFLSFAFAKNEKNN